MKIEQKKIAELIPYARNARTHSEAQVAQIAGSIREFGFNNPVLVAEDGTIIAGHGRVMAARKLGLEEVPCVVLAHLTETQRRAYVLADNKLALNAGWDDEMLAVELDELKLEGVDLSGLGFTAKELAELEPKEETDGDDEVPEAIDDAVSQRGEIYELGPHRLMCGDSTSEYDWQALMCGEIADVGLADPPYNVGFSYDTHEDNMDDEKYKTFCDKWRTNLCRMSKMQAITPGKRNERIHHCLDSMVWNKKFAVTRGSFYRAMVTEPILLSGKKPTGRFYPTDCITVMTERDPELKGQHTCPKPVDLFVQIIEPMTDTGSIVAEAFGGSGTTLIACAKTGRFCRAMEISPRYCDVIRRRWTRWAKDNGRDVGTGGLE